MLSDLTPCMCLADRTVSQPMLDFRRALDPPLVMTRHSLDPLEGSLETG